MKCPKNLKLGDSVWLSWMDSYMIPGWQMPETSRDTKNGHIISTGFICGLDPEYIGITNSFGINGTYNDPLYIPWFAIKTLKKGMR